MKVELAQSAYVLLLDNKSGRIECPEESSRSDMLESICCQKAADTTLGKNPDDGLYLAYRSLSGQLVGGSRCCLITTN